MNLGADLVINELLRFEPTHGKYRASEYEIGLPKATDMQSCTHVEHMIWPCGGAHDVSKLVQRRTCSDTKK